MENSVVIKGNKHGIVVVLNENVPYDDLKEQVRDKFIASSKFFGNAAMALGFEGRSMTFDQQVEMADIITDVSQLNIVCLIDEKMLLIHKMVLQRILNMHNIMILSRIIRIVHRMVIIKQQVLMKDSFIKGLCVQDRYLKLRAV